MTENSTRRYQDGPPTGENMAALVSETQKHVLRRIGAPAESIVALQSTETALHSSANREFSAGPTRPDVPAKPWRRATTEVGPRRSFIALSAIAAVLVLSFFLGARLVGVDTWRLNAGFPSSVGGSETTTTPTSKGSGLIDESEAIQIALMANSAPATSATAPAEARLMSYDAWMTGYDKGSTSSLDPSQMVWAVSINAPSSFPGYGSPGSTVPPSDGYTVLINANTGDLISFRAQPTTFTPEESAATQLGGESTLTGTEPLKPGQEPLSEAAAISQAIVAGGAPSTTETKEILIPFAEWPAKYGGSDFVAVDRDRPVWVVNVYAPPKFRFTGPPGGATPKPSNSYSVLIDSFSGDVMEITTESAEIG